MRTISLRSAPLLRKERSQEALGKTYETHFPSKSYATCRNVKLSPLHFKLLERRAVFRDVSGWESPMYYSDKDQGNPPPPPQYSFGREENFAAWKKEHFHIRKKVGLIDMSFMSKFEVVGNDAGDFLNHLATSDVDKVCGEIQYTQLLDDDGYMQADLTICKLAEDRFLIVVTDTQHNHVLQHLKKRLDRKSHCFINDVTNKYAQINLMGPRSRELMEKLSLSSNGEFSNEGFKFRQAKEIEVGYCNVLAVRITYVGEVSERSDGYRHDGYIHALLSKSLLLRSGAVGLGTVCADGDGRERV